MNWNDYPNFKESEFRCSHCGKVSMQPEFLKKLQQLRTAYAKPLRVTSGYRCPDHPVEAKKAVPGAHASGCAADLAVEGRDAYEVLKLALHFGFTGIGVQQQGSGRFIHLDTLTESPRPNVWSY
jgi:zinc D-Ala-D-Ala carboxypeptidase